MPVNPASAPGFGMFDEYGRRLSAHQKLTHETLIFFGNFARQNGVIKDQLNIGFRLSPPVSSATRASRERCTLFPNNTLFFGFSNGDQLLH